MPFRTDDQAVPAEGDAFGDAAGVVVGLELFVPVPLAESVDDDEPPLGAVVDVLDEEPAAAVEGADRLSLR